MAKKKNKKKCKHLAKDLQWRADDLRHVCFKDLPKPCPHEDKVEECGGFAEEGK